MSGEDIPVRCGKIAVAVLRGEGADAKVLFGAAVRGHTGGSVVPGYRPHRLIFAIFFYDPGANSVEALPMFPAMAATDSEVRLNSGEHGVLPGRTALRNGQGAVCGSSVGVARNRAEFHVSFR